MSRPLIIQTAVLEAALKEIKKIIPNARFLYRAAQEDACATIHFLGVNVDLETKSILGATQAVKLRIERKHRYFSKHECLLPPFEDPRFRPQMLIDLLMRLALDEYALEKLETDQECRLTGAFAEMKRRMNEDESMKEEK